MAKHDDAVVPRGPGRPPSYVFDKPDDQLSDLERRLKLAVMKRRLRQNRNYHRRKLQKGKTQDASFLTKSNRSIPEQGDRMNSALSSDHGVIPQADQGLALRSTQGHPVSRTDQDIPQMHKLPHHVHAHQLASSSALPTNPISGEEPSITDNDLNSSPLMGDGFDDRPFEWPTRSAINLSPPYPDPGVFPAAERDRDVFKETALVDDLLSVVADESSSNSMDSSVGTQGSSKYCCPIPEFSAHNFRARDTNVVPEFALQVHKAPAAHQLSFGMTSQSQLLTSATNQLFGEESSTAGNVQGSNDEFLSDADLLLDELLNLESQSSVASSTAMMHIGVMSVVSSLSALPQSALVAAHALSIFQDSFEQDAALAMIGHAVPGTGMSALEPLFSCNLLSVVDKSGDSARFALNPLLKQVVPQFASHLEHGMIEFGVPSTGMTTSSYVDDGLRNLSFLPPRSVLEHRFVAYYGHVLSDLSDTPCINLRGAKRMKAMIFFDAEQKHVHHALHLSHILSSKIELDFLRKSAAVMRFCTDAKTRAHVFQAALDGYAFTESDAFSASPVGGGHGSDNFSANMEGRKEDEIEVDKDAWRIRTELEPLTGLDEVLETDQACKLSESVKMPRDSSVGQVEDAEAMLAKANDTCTWWNNTARIHLALGEAYFDMLDIEKAVEPLEKGMELLNIRNRRPECPIQTSSLVLGKLLLAEISAQRGDVKSAKSLLLYALSLLSGVGLKESTFTVNAINTLVHVQMSMGAYDEAVGLCSRMLDILITLGYDQMPIYADALGTMAVVHLNMKQFDDAERVFCSALEVIHTWVDKTPWRRGVPYEHCQDLDIWLLEGLAAVHDAQGNVVQANLLRDDASRRRSQRGLAEVHLVPAAEMSDLVGNNPGSEVRRVMSPLYSDGVPNIEGTQVRGLAAPDNLISRSPWQQMPPSQIWAGRLSYPRHGY